MTIQGFRITNKGRVERDAYTVRGSIRQGNSVPGMHLEIGTGSNLGLAKE